MIIDDYRVAFYRLTLSIFYSNLVSYLKQYNKDSGDVKLTFSPIVKAREY